MQFRALVCRVGLQRASETKQFWSGFVISSAIKAKMDEILNILQEEDVRIYEVFRKYL